MDSFRIMAATGSYRFAIDHSKTKDTGVDHAITSPEFRVGKHDWTIHYYPREGPNKDGVESASVYIGLERASVDVTATLECALLDKNGHVASSAIFNKYSCTFPSDSDDLWGWPYFMPRTDLEETYVRDDGFFVLKVSITVKDESCPSEACQDYCAIDSHVLLFPYERTKRFREEKIRTDVTFDVDGSLFVAHRLILAVHSPVFEAELFGTMAESNMDCIKISEMMPSVFNAMLDFMYSGLLPVAEELKNNENATPSTSFFQDLFVAADQYAVGRLRSMCEHKLVASIRSENVLSLLELAERHSCTNLKADCLKFIANKDNLVSLVLTKACIKLLHNCPSLLTELNEMANK